MSCPSPADVAAVDAILADPDGQAAAKVLAELRVELDEARDYLRRAETRIMEADAILKKSTCALPGYHCLGDVADARHALRDEPYTGRSVVMAVVDAERKRAAALIRSTPLAPDTHTGTRQKWVLENAARRIEGREPPPWTGAVDERLRPGGPLCTGCGGPHPFDTTIESALWNRVVRANRLPEHLCAACIIRVFGRERIAFEANLSGEGVTGLVLRIYPEFPARVAQVDGCRVSTPEDAGSSPVARHPGPDSAVLRATQAALSACAADPAMAHIDVFALEEARRQMREGRGIPIDDVLPGPDSGAGATDVPRGGDAPCSMPETATATTAPPGRREPSSNAVRPSADGGRARTFCQICGYECWHEPESSPYLCGHCHRWPTGCRECGAGVGHRDGCPLMGPPATNAAPSPAPRAEACGCWVGQHDGCARCSRLESGEPMCPCTNEPPRACCVEAARAMREAAAGIAKRRQGSLESESKLLDREYQLLSYQRILEAYAIEQAISALPIPGEEGR